MFRRRGHTALFRAQGGFSVVELLIVLATIGVLLALVLGAIQRVREAGLRAQSTNKLKQIALAVQGFAAEQRQRLPSIDSPTGFGGLFCDILPYMEGKPPPDNDLMFQEPAFLSPADPTIDNPPSPFGIASYAANARVFSGKPRLPFTFRDGTSATIAFAEHYSTCGDSKKSGGGILSTRYLFALGEYNLVLPHRATFADIQDYVPAFSRSRAVLVGPKETFQVAPALLDCEPTLANTPHATGMLGALGDGSVRTLSPGMSWRTYWSAVTPAGGEVLGPDW
jgi:type II secretory pathway pseudopilin PulG